MLNSSTTTVDSLQNNNLIPPVHPGEILSEDFIVSFNLTQDSLAHAINVPSRQIDELIRGERNITANLAIRLARYFSTSEEFWMNLQAHYDLRISHQQIGKDITKIIPLHAA